MSEELIREPLKPDEIIDGNYALPTASWLDPSWRYTVVQWPNAYTPQRTWQDTDAIKKRLRMMGLEIP